MKYLNLWQKDLLSRKSLLLKSPIEVEGLRDKHLGPMMQYAKVVINVKPSEIFDVDISSIKLADENQINMLNAAIFGFLDIVMCAKISPLKNIKLIVTDVEFDPINSSIVAFRYAGRDAGQNLIKAISQE